MNVLSLFDGMSCGMIALDRLGIKVDNYYASEIDKYAMQVSAANYPEIIQVGDITKLNLSTLPKIDLVMGGSPCQGFSFAGKQLAFDDPRSALFFEFVKCVKELNPKYFLLENVRMKKEYLDIISEYMGVEPIFINSSLVSAQSRQRYYWTNIPNVTPPEERGIVLRDILEDYPNENPVKHTERNARHLKQLYDKSLCMTATMYKGAGNNGMTLVPQRLVDNTSDLPKKSQTIKSQYYKSSKANFERSGTFHATGIPQKLVSDKPQDDKLDKMTTKDGKAYCVTASYTAAEPKNSIERKQRTMIPLEDGQELPENITLVYDNDGKSYKPQHIGTAVDINGHDVFWRKLTPLECERLQTVPDNYTNHVSNTQRYKMLGNGWTIEVIAHIFKNMEREQERELRLTRGEK
jgi:DNA-cytosine methyltransferase